MRHDNGDQKLGFSDRFEVVCIEPNIAINAHVLRNIIIIIQDLYSTMESEDTHAIHSKVVFYYLK